MFVIVTNQRVNNVYGPFASVNEATVWARHHLVGFCWSISKLAALAA